MELHQSQLTALALAGTVALPSPFPAYGPISLVAVDDDGELEVMVKIVQVVSPRRIITRFIRPEDIRAIRGNPDGTIGAGPESWPILDIKKLQADLDGRIEQLLARTGEGGDAEGLWFPAAIVYVPEAAPVLHRNEVGVTAAVSAEEVGFGSIYSRCCRGTDPAEVRRVCCHAGGPSPVEIFADDDPPAGEYLAAPGSHCCHVGVRPFERGRGIE
jgi:hypothetical protein